MDSNGSNHDDTPQNPLMDDSPSQGSKLPDFVKKSDVSQPQPPPITTTSKPHAYIIFAAIIAVAAVGGIGYGVYSQLPKHSLDNSSTPQNAGQKIISTVDQDMLAGAYDKLAGQGMQSFSDGNKQKTIDAYIKLTNNFKIDESFWHDDHGMLLSLAVAQTYLKDKPELDTLYASEMYELMKYSLTSIPKGITDKSSDITTNKNTITSVYQKYTDTELTESLHATLKQQKLLEETAGILKTSVEHLANSGVILAMNFDSEHGADFMRDRNIFGSSPAVWTEKVGDKTYTVLTSEIAQKYIASPDGDQKWMIMHELTHASQPLYYGNLGWTVEERRAELLTGDRAMYWAEKQLFIYAEIFSGVDIPQITHDNVESSVATWIKLYNTFGLKTTNKLLAAYPSDLINNKNQAISDTIKLAGDYDGIIQDMVAYGNKDKAAVNSRLKARVKKLFDVFKTKTAVIDDTRYSVLKVYRMPTAAQLVEDYINNHYK